MTVKELIAKLLTLNPDAKVACYDGVCQKDFLINNVTVDEVIDIGVSDGFCKEYSLRHFFINGISACDREPLGSEVVVLH